MKNLIFILVMMFSLMNATNATNNTDNSRHSSELTTPIAYEFELPCLSMVSTTNTIMILESTYDSCTLSAEVSYKGASTTISITADDCYKAGAGIAQAVKGFMDEVNKK